MRLVTTALLSLAFLIGYVGVTNADDPAGHPAIAGQVSADLSR